MNTDKILLKYLLVCPFSGAQHFIDVMMITLVRGLVSRGMARNHISRDKVYLSQLQHCFI